MSSSSYSGSRRRGGRWVDDTVVRVRLVRVLVQELQVRVRRGGVEVEVVLLAVLAVVPSAFAEAEHPLLKDRVLPFQSAGQGHRRWRSSRTPPMPSSPPVRTAPGLVVCEVGPRVAVQAVVLPDRTPLPFAQVRPPALATACRSRARQDGPVPRSLNLPFPPAVVEAACVVPPVVRLLRGVARDGDRRAGSPSLARPAERLGDAAAVLDGAWISMR